MARYDAISSARKHTAFVLPSAIRGGVLIPLVGGRRVPAPAAGGLGRRACGGNLGPTMIRGLMTGTHPGLAELTEDQRRLAISPYAVLRRHIEGGVPLPRIAAEARVPLRS